MIGSGGRDGGTGANPPSTLGSTRKSIVRGSLTEIIHMRERERGVQVERVYRRRIGLNEGVEKGIGLSGRDMWFLWLDAAVRITDDGIKS